MEKKRRVVRRRKNPPPISELKATANAMGMTTKEYVDYLAEKNRKRGRSATHDQGPEPWKTTRGQYDRVKKGIKKERE